MELQGKSVKENSLYRQNYCGCLFGLTIQRDNQKKLMDEMFNPISNQILPDSIEERLELYKTRNNLEDSKKDYKIIKQKFLNYRLLSGKVIVNKEVIPSYIFAYSILNNKGQSSARLEFIKDDIYYFNRDDIKFIELEIFNKYAKKEYKNIKELIFNPPLFKEELEIRDKILNNPYDLSALIVIDKIENVKYDIYINSAVYEDTKEEII